ncbi:flippase [Sulfurimonas diazotrophicus]|uniref:Flippase n=1 Tax=Sulfurimonas diazotrophicus TaxID=3131939 RepID=A0ABZ3HBB1_9BACT
MYSVWRRKLNQFFRDERFSEIARGGLLTFGAKIVAVLLGIGSSFIVARFYGAEVVGTLALINAFLSVALIVSLMGTDTSLLKIIPEHLVKYSLGSAKAAFKKTMHLVLLFSFVISIFSFALSDVIASGIFSKPHLSFLFALASTIILFKSLQTLNMTALRGMKNIKLFVFFQWFPSAFYLVALIVVTLVFYDKYNPVYIQLFTPVLMVVISSYFVWSHFKGDKERGGQVHMLSYENIFSTAHPMFLTSVLFLVISQTDVIMLGVMSDEASLGIYSIVLKLAGLTAFLLTAINTILGPKFSELYHRDKIDELIFVARKSSKMIFWSSAPLLILLIAGGHWILGIFGSSFETGYLALVILAVGQFVNAASGSVGYFLNMTGNQTVYRNIIIIASAVNITGNYLLIPSFGIKGAAAASLLSLLISNLLPLFYIKGKFGSFIGYFPLRVSR